jgi:hypothetical protein
MAKREKSKRKFAELTKPNANDDDEDDGKCGSSGKNKTTKKAQRF